MGQCWLVSAGKYFRIVSFSAVINGIALNKLSVCPFNFCYCWLCSTAGCFSRGGRQPRLSPVLPWRHCNLWRGTISQGGNNDQRHQWKKIKIKIIGELFFLKNSKICLSLHHNYCHLQGGASSQGDVNDHQVQVHRSVHAGEFGPSDVVFQAIERLRAERIVFGYSVLLSPSTINTIKSPQRRHNPHQQVHNPHILQCLHKVWSRCCRSTRTRLCTATWSGQRFTSPPPLDSPVSMDQ